MAAVMTMAAASLVLWAEGEGKAVAQPKTAGRVIENLNLHLALAGMKVAEAPRVIEGELVLSASGPYRSVAAAFAHEGFVKLHAYERNRQGVFVLAYPIPLKWESGSLEYRVIIDGVWTLDPANPERVSDSATGLELSSAAVPRLSDLHLGLYRILGDDGRTAHFIFRGAKGESVTVCGDFNNWDPFIHAMCETSPGVYQLELPLSQGRHYYDFVYRGEELPDPLNPAKAATRDGKEVSVLVVE
jgi:Glycogen recognition site of AMP-activated protein kinase